MKIELNDDDTKTILAYFRNVQKQRGYKGPCFINLTRLEEIHMPSAELTVQAYMTRLHTFGLQLHQADLQARRDCLLELLSKYDNDAEGAK